MYNSMNQNQYDDIINLPHHVSGVHPQMELLSRAAQFAPFAALTGHDDAIEETARLTDRKIILDENQKAILNEKLLMLYEVIESKPLATFTYFVPDCNKCGGKYISITGVIKKIDRYKQEITLTDSKNINIDDLLNIECSLFEKNKY